MIIYCFERNMNSDVKVKTDNNWMQRNLWYDNKQMFFLIWHLQPECRWTAEWNQGCWKLLFVTLSFLWSYILFWLLWFLEIQTYIRHYGKCAVTTALHKLLSVTFQIHSIRPSNYLARVSDWPLCVNACIYQPSCESIFYPFSRSTADHCSDNLVLGECRPDRQII